MPWNRHKTNLHVHPRIYQAMLGLAFLYLIASWYGFAGSAYAAYLLTVVTGFVALSIGLVAVAWRVRRRHWPGTEKRIGHIGRWINEEIDIAGSPVKGHVAAVEMLLPLAAVAFGMLSFALLAHIVG